MSKPGEEPSQEAASAEPETWELSCDLQEAAEARIARLRGAINDVLSTATGDQWRELLHAALRRDDGDE